MHLSIDELRKRVTLCMIAALECREHTSPNYSTPATLERGVRRHSNPSAKKVQRCGKTGATDDSGTNTEAVTRVMKTVTEVTEPRVDQE